MTRKLAPVHPGTVLKEDVMDELGLSANALARDLHVPPNRITEIVQGKRGITLEMALRLARYLGSSAQFWMNLQYAYDEEVAEDLKRRISTEVRPRRESAA
jgi:addiction module HigA family antidote